MSEKAPAKKPAAKTKGTAPARKFHNRLHERYHNEIVPALMAKYGNIMAVPKLDKIVLNMGLGDDKDDTKKFQNAVDEQVETRHTPSSLCLQCSAAVSRVSTC